MESSKDCNEGLLDLIKFYSENTKLAVIDHISSNHGIILPVKVM